LGYQDGIDEEESRELPPLVNAVLRQLTLFLGIHYCFVNMFYRGNEPSREAGRKLGRLLGGVSGVIED
jgi:hypothetical protein